MAEQFGDLVFSGVALDPQTGRMVSLVVTWFVAAAVLDLRIGEQHPLAILRPEDAPDIWRVKELLFGAPPGGGGGEPRPVADPIAIDGSRRNALLDRLARRRIDAGMMAAD